MSFAMWIRAVLKRSVILVKYKQMIDFIAWQ